jgi:hypothetical protein
MHGGHAAAARLAASAAAGDGQLAPAHQPMPAQLPQSLDALFMETGFQEPADLPSAQTALLARLNGALAARQADGYAVVSTECGAEREGSRRNLHYHVLLRRPLATC